MKRRGQMGHSIGLRLVCLVAAAVAVWASTASGPVHAAPPGCRNTELHNGAQCGGAALRQVPGEGARSSTGPTRATTPRPATETADITDIRRGPDGEPCRITREVEVPDDPQGRSDVLVAEQLYAYYFRKYPPCASSAPPVGTDHDLVATEHWESVTLPAPRPYIAPGKAITGLGAYLETRGALTYSYSNPDTVFGPLEIEARGQYFVDWGDGTVTGPHSVEGQPWPDGQISHSYTFVGSYDVVVEIRWTATWRFGDETGVLDELVTTGVIEDFPVGQIQAVVVG